MKKSDVKKLKKNQIVYYGGYPWKFYSANGYVSGISSASLDKIDRKEYDGYIILMKAIDGKEYAHGGEFRPKYLCLANQYWLGTSADYKKVSIMDV